MKKIKSKLIYIIPTIFIFLLNEFYTTQTPQIQEYTSLEYLIEIRTEWKQKCELYLNEKVNNFEVFSKSFMFFVPFSNIMEYEKIKYVNELNKKCLNSENLTNIEINILNSYNNLLNFDLTPLENNYYSVFGYISSLTIFILLFFIIKRMKNEKMKNIIKYYLILFFFINLLYASDNNAKKSLMKPLLIESFQKKLSKLEDEK